MADENANPSDSQAVIDAVKELHRPVGLERPVSGIVAIPDGMTAVDLDTIINSRRKLPQRRKGLVSVGDLDSLALFTNRYKSLDASVLFAKRDMIDPNLVALLNYHPTGEETLPANGEESSFTGCGDFLVLYKFPRSVEFTAWTGIANRKLSLSEFAAFIDERICDISQPPSAGDLTDERFPGIAELAGNIGGRWASPSDMIALSRGLDIHVEHKVREVRNSGTGEASLLFEEEHKDNYGSPIKVQGMFMITIPVFDQGSLYRIAWRLRYRVANGALSWTVSPMLLERAFNHAFTEACERARDETGLPLVYGCAPASPR